MWAAIVALVMSGTCLAARCRAATAGPRRGSPRESRVWPAHFPHSTQPHIMSIPRHLNPLSSWKFADAQECYKGILSLPNVGRDMDSQEVLMRKVVASELVSLDGVVESPQKWHFPYFNDQMADAIGAAMAASDAMLMGRVLYEEWAAFWPKQDPDENPLAARMNGVRKYVVSRTLEEPLEWENSTLIGDHVAEEITRLKEQPGKDISISGSPTLVRSLFEENLLDELRLMVHPIVVGSGKRLFEDGGDQKALQLVDSKTFSTGVLYLTYQPAQS